MIGMILAIPTFLVKQKLIELLLKRTKNYNISWFDFVKDYQVKYYGKSKQKKEGKKKAKYHFIDNHPGCLHAYMERRIFEVVPMI